jgi:hypothetical protein
MLSLVASSRPRLCAIFGSPFGCFGVNEFLASGKLREIANIAELLLNCFKYATSIFGKVFDFIELCVKKRLPTILSKKPQRYYEVDFYLF